MKEGIIDSREKEEIKRELKEELRKEIFVELKKENKSRKKGSKIEKSFEEKKETVSEPANQSGLGLLIFLIIIILIIDLGSFYFYYHPNIFNIVSNTNSTSKVNISSAQSGKCSDGTLFNQCSKNQPYYCYQGDLVKKASTCGCPSGQTIDFQDCRQI